MAHFLKVGSEKARSDALGEDVSSWRQEDLKKQYVDRLIRIVQTAHVILSHFTPIRKHLPWMEHSIRDA